MLLSSSCRFSLPLRTSSPLLSFPSRSRFFVFPHLCLFREYKQSATDLRIGHVIERNGRLWVITKANHQKTGRGGAFMQIEMKDIERGTKSVDKFRSAESVERVHLEERKRCSFLFQDGDDFIFSDEDHNQISVHPDTIGNKQPLLNISDLQVSLFLHKGTPIVVDFPSTVTVKVVEAPPHLKAATATPQFKPASLDIGLKITIPSFVETGETIEMRVEDFSYVGRVKS